MTYLWDINGIGQPTLHRKSWIDHEVTSWACIVKHVPGFHFPVFALRLFCPIYFTQRLLCNINPNLKQRFTLRGPLWGLNSVYGSEARSLNHSCCFATAEDGFTLLNAHCEWLKSSCQWLFPSREIWTATHDKALWIFFRSWINKDRTGVNVLPKPLLIAAVFHIRLDSELLFHTFPDFRLRNHQIYYGHCGMFTDCQANKMKKITFEDVYFLKV